MSKRKPLGSPLVKSVFLSKKLFPAASADSNFEWSTVDQSTIGKSSLEGIRHDWSEEDSETDGADSIEETGQNSFFKSPEQLRESEVPHPSTHFAPSGPLHMVSAYHHKAQLVRSPAVQSLGDLLNIKAGKFRLLPNCCDSSSSDESDNGITLSLSNGNKMNEVLTSTMVLGGKRMNEETVVENISTINNRVSLDPRLSVHLSRKESVQEHEDSYLIPSRLVRVLSSTPARIDVPGHSLEISSIHSSDVGGSMLVPREEREMFTEEIVEEETEIEGDTWYLVEGKEKTVDHPVNIKQAEMTIREKEVNYMPELVGEEASDVEAVGVEFMKDKIEAELSQLSPDNSARLRSSRTTLSAEDTSGEIFSAVVHRTQTAMVVKCPTMVAGNAARGSSRKKFRLANSSRAVTQLRIYSKAQYYRGKPDSERKFDELMEEEKYNDSDLLYELT